MASPYIALDSPVQRLECGVAWDALSTTEKYYAYHMSRACWQGGVATYFQRSYESPGLFLLFQALFSDKSLDRKSKDAGITELEWSQFLAYAAGVFGNSGNFQSFGDTKILPELPQSRFNLIVSVALNPVAYRIWARIGDAVYKTGSGGHLGFPEEDGVSAYYSPNVSRKDAEFVKTALLAQGLNELHWNSHLLKTDTGFEVRIASARHEFLSVCRTFEHEGKQIKITNGSLGLMMERLVQAMTLALPYCANQTQESMLLSYLKHFTTGDINLHKSAQKYWIKDLQPVVETNIGFIESYADPLHIRSEFEGFVSVVNKPISAKFAGLVNRAPELLAKLPWGKTFEKDKFTPPDFTSLEIVTFAADGVPIGINIPNYDEIRERDGFKNVNLGNAYPKVTPSDLPFLLPSDIDLINRLYDSSETVAVALHELLGHGSGKLLTHNKDGSFNFEKTALNPATNAQIDSWFEEGETCNSRFGALTNAYEECRAETVATFLSVFDEPFEVFSIENKEEGRRMLWLYMAYAGMKGLLYYNPTGKVWGQAHCCARWVIFKVMLEAGLVRIDFKGEDDMLLTMDFDQIPTTGKQAIGDFLTKLHCFQATGDVVRGSAFFKGYSEVDATGLQMRNIVIAHKKPRRMNVQANIFLEAAGPVLHQYSEDFLGLIQSFQDRYPSEDSELLEFWEREYELMRSLGLNSA